MVSVSVNIDVVYIMQTLGGCVSVEVHIDIVIIMATIGEVCVICWVSLGPSGPG